MKTELAATVGLARYGDPVVKCHFCTRVGALAGVIAVWVVLKDACSGPSRYAGQSDAGRAAGAADPAFPAADPVRLAADAGATAASPLPMARAPSNPALAMPATTRDRCLFRRFGATQIASARIARSQ